MIQTVSKEKIRRGSFFLQGYAWTFAIFFFWAGICSPPRLQGESVFNGLEADNEAGVHVKVVQLLDRAPEYGFVPVEISIRNDSGKSRTWNFSFTTGAGYNSDMNLHQVHSFEVENGKTRTADILLPLPGVRNNERVSRLEVKVTGYGITRSTGQSQNNWINYSTGPVGLSGSIYTNQNGPLGEALKHRGYPDLESSAFSPEFVAQRKRGLAPGANRELCASSLDFSRIPADWRSYCGLAGIILNEEEWKDLAPAQRQAIEDWMAQGGHLYLTNDGGEKTTVPVGFGAKTELGLAGQATVLLSSAILALDASPAVPWNVDFLKGWGLRTNVGLLRVNTTLIICFVVIFGIVIAPVNLFIFAPARFRHRLFWTVPLISVVASILLVVIILMQEGFGGGGQRLAAVLLLPEEHKMVVVQEQVAKTALLLGQEFALSEKVIFAALPLSNETSPDGSVSRQGDRAGGDWFSSRTVKGYQLKTILPTRARIAVVGRSTEGAPIVLSSFAVPLKNFNLLEKDGKVWSVAELKTGEKQTLQGQGDTLAALSSLVQAKASGNLQQMLLPMFKRAGYFYAEGPSGDGLPLETLASLRWKDDPIIYLGAWTEGGL